ncbi:MAG: hypothetical protein WAU86_10315 [Oricola sp.]
MVVDSVMTGPGSVIARDLAEAGLYHHMLRLETPRSHYENHAAVANWSSLRFMAFL